MAATTPIHRSNPSSSFSSQVRVILRVRPFLDSEIGTHTQKPIPCITALESDTDSRTEVTVNIKDQWSSRSEFYKLDAYFGQQDHVGQIFHDEVSKVIPRIFHGLNATIFAYGATGSGKTYTMQGTEDEPGLIPLALSTILSSCRDIDILVEVSYYEVYLDRCYDLLEPKAKEIMTLSDKDGRVQLKGLSWVAVKSIEEFKEIFSTCVQRRKVAYTGLNDESSRSHGVLSIAVTCGNKKGKLNLIDLAGNEDNRRTCNDGLRLQESAKINQSLFALSNVIYALNNNETYVPYRESKLTRILQDSLGGTSRALMVACLNPISYQEAVHTVSLAARSRQIVNYAGSASRKDTPREKVDMEAKLRAWLESKGKTKNTQKKFGSASSQKTNTANRFDAKTKGRKLFDLGTTSTPTIENTYLSDTGDHGEEADTYSTNFLPSTENLNWQKRLTTPNNNNQFYLPMDDEDHKISTHVEVLKTLESPDKTSNKENLKSSNNAVGSPIQNSMGSPIQNSVRKVLSPISLNVPEYVNKMEPKTPKMLYRTHDEDEVVTIATPLDKFNTMSSNLKESLAQEYLAFLNVASKEELLQLKGIGKRRAEYIVGLRDHSPIPLKSLSDLEKIGLSSKQIHDMFRKMATGIF